MKTIAFRTMLIAALMITCLSTMRAQLYYGETSHLYVGPRTATISTSAPCRSLKKNIVDLNDSCSSYLDKLLKLRGKSYEKQISSS